MKIRIIYQDKAGYEYIVDCDEIVARKYYVLAVLPNHKSITLSIRYYKVISIKLIPEEDAYEFIKIQERI